jgi:DNA-binding response OmpR family regulator
MALGDSDPGFNRTVSAAFFALGMRDLAVCLAGEQMRKAVAATVDIVLCDIDLPGMDFCEFSQDIRHGRIGGNPFAVLIATARPAAGADVAQVLKSGVDDLIFKPVDAEVVVRRVGAFAKRRNLFVVTPAYIGPTRRGMRREDGSDDDAIEVPNTLRAKVVQSRYAADLDKLVETERSVLDDRKAQSGLRTIARLTRQLAQLPTGLVMTHETRRTLRVLANKADEVVMEHKNSATTRNVAAISERIARLVRRAESAPIQLPKIEVNLLLQLSDAALAAFVSASRGTGVVPEIVAIVEEYLART